MLKSLCLIGMFSCIAFSSFGNESHSLKHHIVGGFIGVTDNEEEKETSYGIEYEYRYNQQWGVGLVYEVTPEFHAHHYEDHVNEPHSLSDSAHSNEKDDVSVYLLSAYYHIGAIRLGLGYGKEDIDGGDNQDLFRVSAAYDFHLNENLGLAPTISIDTVDSEQIYVYGLTLTYMF